MKKVIENALEYVKEYFSKDYSGHDFYHTLRVYNLAKNIAESEKCDKELVCLGALLHDVDDYKLFGNSNAENLTNAKIIMKNTNVPYKI